MVTGAKASAGRPTRANIDATATMPTGVLDVTSATMAPAIVTSIIASKAGPMLRTARFRKSSRNGEYDRLRAQKISPCAIGGTVTPRTDIAGVSLSATAPQIASSPPKYTAHATRRARRSPSSTKPTASTVGHAQVQVISAMRNQFGAVSSARSCNTVASAPNAKPATTWTSSARRCDCAACTSETAGMPGDNTAVSTVVGGTSSAAGVGAAPARLEAIISCATRRRYRRSATQPPTSVSAPARAAAETIIPGQCDASIIGVYGVRCSRRRYSEVAASRYAFADSAYAAPGPAASRRSASRLSVSTSASCVAIESGPSSTSRRCCEATPSSTSKAAAFRPASSSASARLPPASAASRSACSAAGCARSSPAARRSRHRQVQRRSSRLLGFAEAALVATQPGELLQGQYPDPCSITSWACLPLRKGQLQRGLAVDSFDPRQHQWVPGIRWFEADKALEVAARERPERLQRAADQSDVGAAAAAARQQAVVQGGGQFAEACGEAQAGCAAGHCLCQARVGLSCVAVAFKLGEQPTHSFGIGWR